MTIRSPRLVLVALAVAALTGTARGDEYAIDRPHAFAVFRCSHVGISWVFGRFKDLSGTFTLDSRNPSATQFDLSAKVDSIDTDNVQRDQHLKSPDFFNAKEFPVMRFKSKSVKAVDGGYEVAGDLTLHGATKPLTIVLKGGKTAEVPAGVHRIGYSTEFTIKRSEFGMDKMLDAIGNDVHVQLSFEGTKK